MKNLALLILLIGLVYSNLIKAQTGESWQEKITQELLTKANEHPVEFLIVFHQQADISEAYRLKTKREKGFFVFEKLKETARQSQEEVLNILDRVGAPYRSFYIVNAIWAKGDIELIKEVAEQKEVTSILSNPKVKENLLVDPISRPGSPRSRPGATARGLTWALQQINIQAVWDMGFRGQGTVIGGQDTGVKWDHPALKEKYRGWDTVNVDHNYNWHDAIHEDPDSNNPCGIDTDFPCDDYNHGTLTTGVAVGENGENQVGVAPQAKWIACRNMDQGNGTPATYIECFEFFLAPYDLAGENPDPVRAPHVINNSWRCPESEGCNPGNFAIMEQVVDNLKAAGIVVVASAGNNGPNCTSINAPPAIFENAFTVGSTNMGDTMSGFSSRGPIMVDSSFRIKPDVVAPGGWIYSSSFNGNYQHASGTSMAGPFVAGLVGVIISANPQLAGQVETIENIIEESAVPAFGNNICEPGTPNATFGHGRIDALGAVTKALDLISSSGEEVIDPVELKIYPNPTKGLFYIKIPNPSLSDKYDLQVFSADGRNVFSEKGVLSGEFWKEVDLGGIPGGVYFVNLRIGEWVFKSKIVKLESF